MGLSLYAIKGRLLDILEQVEFMEGELTPEMEAELNITQEQLEEKCVNYAIVVLDYEQMAEGAKAEAKRLQQLAATYSGKAEMLRDRVQKAMLEFGVPKIENERVKLSFRKSTVVEIDEKAVLPDKYLITKTEVKPDKTALKQDVGRGAVEIDGVRIVERQNLQIK